MAETWMSHGRGIRSKVRARDGKRIFYVETWSKGRRYVEKAGTTEKQAVKLLGQRQAEADNGTYVPPRERKRRARVAAASRLTVSEMCDRYLDGMRARKLRSERWNRDILSAVRAHTLGRLYLDEVSRAVVEDFLSTRRKAGLRVNPALGVVRRVFRMAVEHELLAANPTAKIRRDDEQEREGVYLDAATRAELLAAAETDFRAVLRFLFLTGSRIGEASALEWSDVDLEKKRVRIARTEGSETTKTKKARTVPLVEDAVRLLRDLPTRFKGGRVFLYRGAPLVTTDGPKAREARRYVGAWRATVNAAVRAVTKREADRAERETLERVAATLRKATTHDTRHSFASDYLMRGGSVPALCSICGWSNWRMVQERYGHLQPDYLDAEMARMAGAAGEA